MISIFFSLFLWNAKAEMRDILLKRNLRKIIENKLMSFSFTVIRIALKNTFKGNYFVEVKIGKRMLIKILFGIFFFIKKTRHVFYFDDVKHTTVKICWNYVSKLQFNDKNAKNICYWKPKVVDAFFFNNAVSQLI